MCPQWRRARHDGLVVHETDAYDRVDTVMVEGIVCTGIARTLLDLGAVVPPTVVEHALDRALHAQLVTIPELEALLRRTGRRGRNGTGVLRALVATRVPDRNAESPQERRMARMLVAAGLPEPVLQYEIRDEQGLFVARVDAAYPQWRIAVEYDSDQFHSGALDHARDNDRRNALLRVAWDVVTVRRADLARRCVGTAATIRALRDRRSARFPVDSHA
jgi:very-short-patch-repair endonuclease